MSSSAPAAAPQAVPAATPAVAKVSGAELKKQKQAEKAARRAQQVQGKQSAPPATTPKGEAPKQPKRRGSASASIPRDLPFRQQGQQEPNAAPKEPPPEDKTVEFFRHLSKPHRNTISGGPKDIHPAVQHLGMQFSTYEICGSTARLLATLEVFKELVQSYTVPPRNTLKLHFTPHVLNPHIGYLVSFRPLSISMGNAISWFKRLVSQVSIDDSDAKVKNYLCERIDEYIRERVTYADQAIAKSTAEKIRDGDVILTYAKSSVVQRALLKAHQDGKKFRVIVVDSRPLHEGQKLAETLANAGVEVKYCLINGLSHNIQDATKVLLGAHAMMSNGRLLSRIGTALVAMEANEAEKPVIVLCETIKFTERVALDSIVLNEIAPADELVLPGGALEGWKDVKRLQLCNPMYDVTPAEYIQMIITESGSVPPTSVPVLHRLVNEPDIHIQHGVNVFSSHSLHPYAASAASLSALLALFSSKLSLLAPKTACCLSSTPINQYPKLAPMPPYSGYAHSDPRLKKGRISMPRRQTLTARPVHNTVISNWIGDGEGNGDGEEGEVPKPVQKRTLWTMESVANAKLPISSGAHLPHAIHNPAAPPGMAATQPQAPIWVSPTGKSGARRRGSTGRRLFNPDGTAFDPFATAFQKTLLSPPRSPITKMAPLTKGDRDPVTGRKKLKTSDLPLTSAQRGAVEGLAHTFKKRGGYDSLRKSVWEDLEKSNFEASFKDNLLQVAEAELDKNPAQLLKLDRGKATLLIEEATERREKREAKRQAVRTKEREAADEKRRAERAKRREEEKKIEAESERRRVEREARRKVERDREEEREKELRDRDRDRDRPRDRDRDRDRDERRSDRDRDDRYRRQDDDSTRRSSISQVKDTKPTPKPELSKEEIERLEQEALNDLLKESKRVGQRSRYQLEPDVDASLAPPPRKTMPASAIKPIAAKATEPMKIPTGPMQTETDEVATEAGAVIERLPADPEAEVDAAAAEIKIPSVHPDEIVENVIGTPADETAETAMTDADEAPVEIIAPEIAVRALVTGDEVTGHAVEVETIVGIEIGAFVLTLPGYSQKRMKPKRSEAEISAKGLPILMWDEWNEQRALKEGGATAAAATATATTTAANDPPVQKASTDTSPAPQDEAAHRTAPATDLGARIGTVAPETSIPETVRDRALETAVVGGTGVEIGIVTAGIVGESEAAVAIGTAEMIGIVIVIGNEAEAVTAGASQDAVSLEDLYDMLYSTTGLRLYDVVRLICSIFSYF
ncbi:putative translation initiation factor eIF-2B subunit delta [Lachnellula suecica]|uniref:Translation initiation factor eIF2B subunit delta n=1 Tax=Lachnellula suecica TaxID=602035 RepID=A0A8T9CD33_9HELO|nr:putative translation initiation factor eIF-2B subunit delta [Lachnellula suecica]